MKNKNKYLEKIWEQVPVDYYHKGVLKNIGQRYWHFRKYEIIKNIVKDYCPERILDVGSNGGDLTSKIAKLFPNSMTYAIDAYEKVIIYAKSRHPEVNFLRADAQKLPFKSNYFDLIFCLETLEHILFPQRALKEIRRCLRKNGAVVISMDSGSLLFSFIWFFWIKFGAGKVWRNSHLRKFNKNKLREMIINEGFKIKNEIVSHFGMCVTFEVSKDEKK